MAVDIEEPAACCEHCDGEHGDDGEEVPPRRIVLALAVVERLPWGAISLFAWGWAAYQQIRVISLIQDIVEHIRTVHMWQSVQQAAPTVDTIRMVGGF